MLNKCDIEVAHVFQQASAQSVQAERSQVSPDLGHCAAEGAHAVAEGYMSARLISAQGGQAAAAKDSVPENTFSTSDLEAAPSIGETLLDGAAAVGSAVADGAAAVGLAAVDLIGGLLSG